MADTPRRDAAMPTPNREYGRGRHAAPEETEPAEAGDQVARDAGANDAEADQARGEAGDRDDDGDHDGVAHEPDADEGPSEPSDVRKGFWRGALKRTVREFRNDNLSDWAAALTYYGVLSMFPGLLLVVAGLGVAGKGTARRVVDGLTAVAPSAVRDVLRTAVQNLEKSGQSTAGVVAIVSLVAALWAASGYVAAFMRASNAIYDVPEGRPVWKTLPIRIGLTIVTGILLAVSALVVVVTGGIAEQVGKFLHVGSTVVTVWSIAKWPFLVIVVSLVFALLYWAAPNARQGGFRWVTPGGLLAVFLWVVASGAFAVYVANFGSYNRTYGSLATIVIFLVWLWISNIAVLLGAEFDAELERGRAIVAGHRPSDEPYVELRDSRKVRGGSGGGPG